MQSLNEQKRAWRNWYFTVPKHFLSCMMNHEGSAQVHIIFYKLIDFLFQIQVAVGKP